MVAIMKLTAELSKQDTMLNQLCSSVGSAGHLFDILCSLVEQLPKPEPRLAAALVCARLCTLSLAAHLELVTRPKV